ncbi:MAG: conserved rane protein of unknown function [Myxococcales bacterium]|nr:conserved rane protein of unknown function [Myxococcales bacterium]
MSIDPADEKTELVGDDEQPDAWDRAADWLAAHGALPAIAVLTVVMCAVYARIFRGEVAGDDLTFHMAESARLADCIRLGDWDLWNPSANGGFASAYYYQVLPQLASALPTALFGHHLFWFQLSVFLPLVLAPAAAYRGMRLLGAAPWQAVCAAFAIGFTIGASRWGFSADGTFSVGLYTQTWAFAAFPLSLGYTVRWAQTGRGLAPSIAWSAFVGLCHPFAVIALGLALLFGFLGQLAMHQIDRLLARIARTTSPGHWAQPIVGRWTAPADRPFLHEFLRLALFTVLLVVSLLPVLVPLIVDYAGFGGFPHRVNDEVGPGFTELAKWFTKGAILDHGRAIVLTAALPVIALFGRAPFMRWLWFPAVIYALLLGLGPHMGKTGDDLLPAVRFLGAMQIMLALAIGAGAFALGKQLWSAPERSWSWYAGRYVLFGVIAIGGPALAVYVLWFAPDASQLLALAHTLTLSRVEELETLRWVAAIALVASTIAAVVPAWRALRTEFGIRTGISAVVAALGVLIAVPGAQVQRDRVRALGDYPNSKRPEMMQIIEALKTQPPGRKQVGPGCENHWWNLLSYVYGRVPATLQMGGGGLQASSNYDFLWSVRDVPKTAWLYDAPYFLFEKSKAATQPIGETVIETGSYLVRRLPTPGLVSPIQITGVLAAGPTGAGTPVRKTALAWARTDMPLKNRHLVYAGFGQPGVEPAGTTVRSWRQDSPGDAADIVAEVEATALTTFVVRESWHPRWHAYLDGVEVPVRRVTPDFPAVDVPAGTHVLQLRFERPWWAQLAWLAWPGTVLLAWLGLRGYHRRRIPRARVVR